jgi:DNA-binding LacI/PurR family transcriptional regulator
MAMRKRTAPKRTAKVSKVRPRTGGGGAQGHRHALTAAEVARAAGVSRSVVSRAFTPGAPIAEQTRNHVQTVARRLGYAPNIIARSLITRRSDLVAVVVNTLSDLRDASFFDAVFAALQEIGKQALVIRTHAADDLAEVLRVGVSYQVAGALVFADNVTPAMIKAGFPSGCAIMLNALERRGDDVDAIRIDERSSLLEVVDCLVASGHRRIAYLPGRATAAAEDERLAAVLEGLARHRLRPFGDPVGGDFSYESGVAAARSLLRGQRRPDAMICACDAMALGAIDTARSEFGLDIPRQLSVVGFDDIPLAAWPPYRLTTIRQETAAIVGAAIELLLAGLNDPAREPETRFVPTRLVRRSSARLSP